MSMYVNYGNFIISVAKAYGPGLNELIVFIFFQRRKDVMSVS